MVEAENGSQLTPVKPLAFLPPSLDYSERFRLEGKRAVIFGAGRGMGEATAVALSSVGAEVVCVDLNHDAADEVARKVDGTALVCDVCSPESVDATFEKVHGTIDIVVDVVGMTDFVPLVDMDVSRWQKQLDVNLSQGFFITKYAAPRLTENKNGASMVFVTSIAGLLSAPYLSAYGAAKAGLSSFVRSMANELGPYGVRVNAVAPGATETPQRVRTPEERKRYFDIIPTGYINAPSDIGAVVLFLCGDLARAITGQTLTADGGASVVPPFPWGAGRTWGERGT